MFWFSFVAYRTSGNTEQKTRKCPRFAFNKKRQITKRRNPQ